MIQVTRLNGEKFTINAVYIEKVQSLPDTTVTLTSGKKFFVQEDQEEIIRKATSFYQKVGLTRVQSTVGESYE
ncbi:flagellar FlbD family protein [Salinibacillus xinjiangensis]|uniref:Flagellar protein FlbD n=1 Tax=Salinibacillus xinjiangensis TaxID=1229268 RepID=A0A6G1X327_9BACI|nr:flagellar FlbD family protein [Salinibacillus xinjiangensis]MRG85393.1 flagellar protein FlbD [Salinibacillus xinjiangensis]